VSGTTGPPRGARLRRRFWIALDYATAVVCGVVVFASFFHATVGSQSLLGVLSPRDAPLAAVLAIALAVPVAIRRRVPVRALVIVLAACVATLAVGGEINRGPFLPMALVLFLVASTCRRGVALAGLGAALTLLIVQGVHSGVLQVNYLMGHANLLSKEKELKATNQELERQSTLDPLTGIPNRRFFAHAFEAEWKRALRKNEPLSLLMIDVDYFKRVNDAHGHPYGDECLVRIAKALRQELQRGVDVIARYGGEEFIVLLPDTDLEGAGTVAAGLQGAIAELNIVNRASPLGHQLTVSIGIADCYPSTSLTCGELIARADRALYRAKRRGRNRICWHSEEDVASESPQNVR